MFKRIALILLLACEGLYPQPEPVNDGHIPNFWSGSISLGPIQIPVSIFLEENLEGLLKGNFYCAEYKLSELPLEKVVFENGLFHFELPPLNAIFHGTLSPFEITGQFKQSGFRFPATLKPISQIPNCLRRPQEPKPPFPYKTQEIIFENKIEKTILSGTLTLPDSEGPFLAVLLVAGSGPNDRNEEILGHKPFLVLADHLTRQGIAVLRFDKRGVGESTGEYDTATIQNFAEDVLCGIEYLSDRSEIDPSRIGLIGHSEGSIISSMVAANSEKVAFIVLMGGPAVTGEELLYAQGISIDRSKGMSEELIAWECRLTRAMFSIIKSECEILAAESLLKKCVSVHLADLSDQLKKELEANRDEYTCSIHTDAAINQMNTLSFRYFLTCDPSDFLRQIKVPVLALNGELDHQVVSHQNLPAIAKALEDGGNQNFTVLELSSLNHLFQTCQTGAIYEYENIEETISPRALSTISDWLRSQL